MEPIMVLNLKTYAESTGEKGLELCRLAQAVAEEVGVKIAVAPQAVDLEKVVKAVKLPVFAQAAEAAKQGAHTGSITLESIKAAGCRGTILNHSERRMVFHELAAAVEKAIALDLQALVCTVNAAESRAVACLKPTYIAVEPPELIGSGVSVSTAKPELVRDTVKEVKRIADVPVLCGAGVTTGGDVKKALELGADGVLLASAFVKAADPRGKLLELARGMK